MGNEDLDFQAIQKIFTDRDKRQHQEKENLARERRSQLTLIDNRSKLRDEPAYENMHAKNIKVTEKGYEYARGNNLIVKIGIAVMAVTIIFASSIIYGVGSNLNKNIGKGTSIVDFDKDYDKDKGSTQFNVIDPTTCDLSNLTILLRRATPGVNKVTSVASRELNELGVDNRIVTSNDDIVDVVDSLKKENPHKEIIVINMDGNTNKELVETIVMTNYDNSLKSADALALAIYNGNKDIYGITSEIRCGEEEVDGYSKATPIEMSLVEAGHRDVCCLTIAPTTSCVDSEIEVNNLATSIVEGIIRFASLDEQEKESDLIIKTKPGDSINSLASASGVSESYIRSINSDIVSTQNGVLPTDTAMIVAPIPKKLTSSVSVENQTITTNPNDITTKVVYYEVVEGDTVWEIANNLEINPDEFIVPSGDKDKIFPGDKIGYETNIGKILVSKMNQKTK